MHIKRPHRVQNPDKKVKNSGIFVHIASLRRRCALRFRRHPRDSLKKYSISDMKNQACITDYEAFSSLMLDGRLYLDPSMTFRRVCAMIPVSASSLDRLLKRELGAGGDEIMERFREGDVRKLLFLPF